MTAPPPVVHQGAANRGGATPGSDVAVRTVAVGGFGAIGEKLARCLDDGIPGLRLAAVSARDRDRAAKFVASFAAPVPVLALEALAETAEIVVECAPAAVFRQVAEPALGAGGTLVAVSAGALLDNDDLVDLARARGGRIIVPSGALLGLDAVAAANQGIIRTVRMITRKPPAGLAGAPYLAQHGIDLDAVRAPLKVFEGTAREAVKGFPANVNVAVALSLAGIGPDRTRIEIWADPGVTRNTHTIDVDADSSRFSMTIENVPSEDNPRTGKITVLSVLALLRKLTSPLQIGG